MTEKKLWPTYNLCYIFHSRIIWDETQKGIERKWYRIRPLHLDHSKIRLSSLLDVNLVRTGRACIIHYKRFNRGKRSSTTIGTEDKEVYLNKFHSLLTVISSPVIVNRSKIHFAWAFLRFSVREWNRIRNEFIWPWFR